MVINKYNHRLNIAIIYGPLLHYRIPLFNALCDRYNISVFTTFLSNEINNCRFNVEVFESRNYGPFQFQPNLQKRLREGSFELCIVFFDVAHINSLLAVFQPVAPRTILWGPWLTKSKIANRIRVSAIDRCESTIFYCNEHLEEFLNFNLDKKKLYVAPNTVEVPIDITSGSEAEKDIILFVGSFNKRKGLDRLVCIFKSILGKIDDNVNLVLVGDGAERSKLKSLIISLGLNSRVKMPGKINNPGHLAPYYKKAVISVSLSQAGLSVLQSMGFGVPFLTVQGSISGGETLNIVNGVNGFIVENTDEAISEALLNLLNDKKKIVYFGKMAREHYLQYATIENYAQGFYDAVEKTRETNVWKGNNFENLKSDSLHRIENNKNCEICTSLNTKVFQIRDGLEYLICRNCGHSLLVSGELSLHEIFKSSQSKYFGHSNILIPSGKNPLEEEIMAKRSAVFNKFVKVSSKILEVGPGAGIFLRWLADNNHSVTAVEDSTHLADSLKSIKGINILTGSFEDINVKDNYFDVFCSYHVLEHVADPKAFLAKALKSVRPGGLAFIATPNGTSWQQRFFPKLSPNFDVAHLRVFSKQSLSLLAKELGWSVMYVETPEYSNSWLRVFSKLIRKIRKEDEEKTAGKYQIGMSIKMFKFLKTITFVTSPFRFIQNKFQGGNEILIVLRRTV